MKLAPVKSSFLHTIYQSSVSSQGGVFRIDIALPQAYPFKAPKMRVDTATPVYHCNFNKEGFICLDLLMDCFNPSQTIVMLLRGVSWLLSNPDPDSPASQDIAHLFKANREQHDEEAAAATRQRALCPPSTFPLPDAVSPSTVSMASAAASAVETVATSSATSEAGTFCVIVKNMAGDEVCIATDSAARVLDVKRRVYAQWPDCGVARQRLVLMRDVAADGDNDSETHTVLVNNWTLASYEIADETTLELIITEEMEQWSSVRSR